MTITNIILETVDIFINKYNLTNARDINNGLCVDFADEVSSVDDSFEGISIDFFLVDGWNGCEDDEWDEDMLSEYNLKPVNIDFEKLVYHVFIYDGSKFYDSECIEGATSFLDLPIYKRILNE